LPVAVRLAGGGVLKIATAGKPDCYEGLAANQNHLNHKKIPLKINGLIRFRQQTRNFFKIYLAH